MKRNCCTKCHYPETTCVCHYVTPSLSNKTKIVVLQYPDEVSLAKNTVRLLKLQLTNICVFTGESSDDFTQVQKITQNQRCALLYPNEQAITVQQLSEQHAPIDVLIVIDGTWKKTHKIFALNPWLNKLPKVTFSQIPKNQYRIRKAEQAHSLSTLEAVSLFLNEYEQIDQQPLLNLLNGMVMQQTKLMPEHVKSRYKL
ncbi:hypothetical protein PSECIP111951_04085 [Pseudoalteromonas holothuriae]|uniref:tRNA-uridine aminocarboxypropyltransferase n=1 Tax=Pseudoalteromonas holothuriae TaxID=2963714 RepID=A0A9W4QYW9_9GAMM|nr:MULTISPECIES: tRNA-uridine aminocarboxypropyltransferase [unclassified Pseudoalteromonas]CAH9058947.1 hypothetical protein PSECIP111854_02305 [Pseudoalteromonas sp. CIP111854]CAH9068251.1 hypothetical protein PSECIP111951_04085 [Pseudoalteromonas sp. CIP111951]